MTIQAEALELALAAADQYAEGREPVFTFVEAGTRYEIFMTGRVVKTEDDSFGGRENKSIVVINSTSEPLRLVLSALRGRA